MEMDGHVNTQLMSNPFHAKRLMLKISGEALMGQHSFGVDAAFLNEVANNVASLWRAGYEICVVLGGGNFFRGANGVASGMDQPPADYAGMLATMMNGVFFRQALEKEAVKCRLISGLSCPTLCEPYHYDRCRVHLNKGHLLIFVGGTGAPFFTTDTAAVLRAVEMKCDVLLKATNVDGIYDADPKKVPTAKRFECIDYQYVLEHRLRVMDQTAFALACEKDLPIIVFSMADPQNLTRLMQGDAPYTRVTKEM